MLEDLGYSVDYSKADDFIPPTFIQPTPTPSATPSNSIFSPDSKTELQSAVDAWDADSTSARELYHDISLWDTSKITDMSHI